MNWSKGTPTFGILPRVPERVFMGYVIKAFALVCWTILVPFLIGMLPCSLLPQKRRTPGMILLSGYFVSYAVFELVGLPVLLLTKTGNFPLLVLLYTILAAAMAMAGYVLTGGVSGVNWTAFLGGPSGGLEADTDVVDLKTLREETKSSPLIPAVLWAAFLCLLLYEFYMAYTHLFFDGDDAYYVVQSVISWETNTMYHYLPYTGGSTSLDLRHAMAMFPMWVAYLARISTMHPTAVAHSFLPMLMIALSDLLLFQTASSLFEGGEFRRFRRELLPMFMILCAVLQIWGNTSIYTPETFLMMRSWQGKSVFVNFIVPAVFLLFLRIYRVEKGLDVRSRQYYWCMLLCVNLAAGLCSSMAIVLAAMLTGLCGLFIAVADRKWRILLRSAVCCIPTVVYVGIYFLLK